MENGIVIDIKGDSTAAQIRQQFGEAATRLRSKDRELVWTVAEFGFGMNPEARLTGHVLEDEKRQGTCYFSIGDNSSLGGNATVGIHIPGVLSKPSVWLDDTQILDNGVFLMGSLVCLVQNLQVLDSRMQMRQMPICLILLLKENP